MLDFNKENKITFEQLSFSLQNKLRKLVLQSEINRVENTLKDCEECLNGVRFSYTTNLNTIDHPINDRDVAIVLEDGVHVLYIYTGNRWIKIPIGNVYYLMKIVQSPNQIITATINNKEYTSDINLQYGTQWNARIESTFYYIPGTLSDTSGIIREAYTLSASHAILKKDFVLNAVIGKHATTDVYGIKLNWYNSDDPTLFYGSLEPNMFDTINIGLKSGSSSGYTSAINFYDAIPVPPLYEKITMNMEYNGTTHYIFNRYDLSNFNATGDLKDYPEFTTQAFYNLFKSLKGKRVRFNVHFD